MSSRLARLSAAYAQCLALKALARAPVQPNRLRLVHPRCAIETGAGSITHLYDEVFCQELYESPKPIPAAPRIVDVGGHLGLASLFFLSRYPACSLLTLEPNPALATLLRKTLAPFAERVQLLEAALSTRAGDVEFHITADNLTNVTGGIDNREGPEREVRRLCVPCVDARDVLAEPVDLLKLDVEGHEYELLPLELFRPAHVRNMVVEFHDLDQRAGQFRELLGCLVGRGYRVANMDDVELGPGELAQLRGCVVLQLF